MGTNNSTIHIRSLESKDYMPIAAIWRDVFTPVEDESVAGVCERMRGDSCYRIFVADMEGKVVGFVTTVEALSINLPNGYIKINGLAVLPEYRRQGIGKMLMERVEKLAVERGVSLIELASGFQRTAAHEFYEHLGYQKTSFRLSKRTTRPIKEEIK